MEWHEYGLDGVDALRVVVSCVVFYFGIIIVVRLFGQRALASLSSFDLAAIIALGAVVGRAILGDTPTRRRCPRRRDAAHPPGGDRAGAAERPHRGHRQQPRDRPHGGRGVPHRQHGPRPCRSRRSDLEARMAGIRELSEVACVILEPTGQISVIKRGRPIDPVPLDGVVGAERIPRSDIG